MSNDTYLRVFCYDVTNNKRRRRIARLLEDHASRVQYSVFETRMGNKAVLRLVEQIEKFLEQGDSLRVYTIGRNGERHCLTSGDAVPIENEASFWLL